MTSQEQSGPHVCGTCGKTFDTYEAAQKHRVDVHRSHRKLPASQRPKDRGPVACGVGSCPSTFKDEDAARQHRLAKHGIVD